MWIFLAEVLIREAAAYSFHVLDVLIDEAVERNQLAADRQAAFEHGGPEFAQLNSRENANHLECSDEDFDCERHWERNHSVEHLLLLDIESVRLVQGDLV